MENASIQKSNPLKSYFVVIVVVLSLIVTHILFHTVFGSCEHFEAPDDPTKACTDGHPVPGDYFGIVYKGGFVVPIAMAATLVMFIFMFERIFTIMKASGSSSVDVFIKKVRLMLGENRIDDAIAACDAQRGSVANVVKAGLIKYKEVDKHADMDKDAKKAAIQQEVEEATTLELPMLEKNLVVIATIASIATLLGLIGTVLGMIKAFAGLANAGAPDTAALATGISEALVNTALGISTSTIAIILYNTFTSVIDGITYRIDESGYSIIQTFEQKHNK